MYPVKACMLTLQIKKGGGERTSAEHTHTPLARIRSLAVRTFSFSFFSFLFARGASSSSSASKKIFFLFCHRLLDMR